MRIFVFLSIIMVGFAWAVVGAFGLAYAVTAPIRALALLVCVAGVVLIVVSGMWMERWANDARRLPVMEDDPDEHLGITALKHRRIGTWSSLNPIDTRKGHGR